MRGRADKPSKLLQVYVDDFCYAATQSRDGTHIPTIRRAAIHGIEAVFPPPAITNHKDGKEPISASKLLKGDGNFESKKDMIGFSFDGIKRTVHLPPKKAAAYILHQRNSPSPAPEIGPAQDPSRCGGKTSTRIHYSTRSTRILHADQCSDEGISEADHLGRKVGSQSSIGRSVHPPTHPGLTANACQRIGSGHAAICGIPRCGSRRSGRSMVLADRQHVPDSMASWIPARHHL